MGSETLGVVVIGQAPRLDIEAELREVLGERTPVRVVGALDGLSRAEIDHLRPGGPHDALFTNLPDGTGVVISGLSLVQLEFSVIRCQ